MQAWSGLNDLARFNRFMLRLLGVDRRAGAGYASSSRSYWGLDAFGLSERDDEHFVCAIEAIRVLIPPKR